MCEGREEFGAVIFSAFLWSDMGGLFLEECDPETKAYYAGAAYLRI